MRPMSTNDRKMAEAHSEAMTRLGDLELPCDRMLAYIKYLDVPQSTMCHDITSRVADICKRHILRIHKAME